MRHNTAKVCGLTLRIVYTTRPYLTKHGAGPLPGEYTPDPPIVDETNVDHPYQGRIRFGQMDRKALRGRIEADLKIAGTLVSDWALGITCLDHVGGESALPKLVADLGPTRYYSVGSDRSDTAEIVK